MPLLLRRWLRGIAILAPTRNLKKLLAICLLVGLQLFVFLLGRFSSQLTTLELSEAIDKLSNKIPNGHSRYEAQSKNAALSPPVLPSTYLLIVIITRPEDSHLRETIRDTWLRLSTKTPKLFRYVFPVGTKGLPAKELEKLKEEKELSGANLMLLANLTDAYERLALKTALSIQVSVETYRFDYLLKVDGDSFVRLGALLQALRDIAHPRLYWGFLDGRARPFRKGKWKEKEWLLCDHYLPYQLGGGYVLARRLAEFVAANAKLLKFYRSEDVSVGAWLAGLDVRYVHDPRFDTEFASRGCHNEYLVTHKKGAEELRELFDNVRSGGGALCGPRGEYRLRGSYVYDFSALPSQCCHRRNDSRVP